MPIYPAPHEVMLESREADCLATDAVGDSVSVSGAAVGGIMQVTKTDPKVNGLTAPAIGILVAKITATRCVVKTYGLLDVLQVLTPGKAVYVGADSLPTSVVPTPDVGSRIACQVIGVAVDAGRLFVHPERRPTIRTG